MLKQFDFRYINTKRKVTHCVAFSFLPSSISVSFLDKIYERRDDNKEIYENCIEIKMILI